MLKTYRTALYERLSHDDGTECESESILTQQQMLEDYCKTHEELIPVRHYTDDGYSGVSFERPSFQKMIGDIEQGFIDCVIVKDLSRFGRDYISMGNYLERIFPRLGIRFIAINDHIDNISGKYTMLLPIINLFNAQYSKDISQKVRSAIKTKQQSGCFTGAYAPFGYMKDDANRNHLVIDNEAAQVIKRIFDMYLSGMGKTAIASVLNSDSVLSPKAYRSHGSKAGSVTGNGTMTPWNILTIDRILRNPVYAGDMPVSKTTRIGVCGKKRLNSQHDLEIIESTHEAIINREIWIDTQRLLADRYCNAFPSSESKALFSGMLFCGICGCRMTSVNVNNKRVYYCRRYKTSGASSCRSHHITENKLKEVVLEDINSQIRHIEGIESLFAEIEKNGAATDSSAKASNRLALLMSSKQKTYEDYKDGMIDIEAYLTAKAEIDEQISAARNTLSKILDMESKKSQWVDIFKTKRELSELDRTTLQTMVERIVIDGSESIEIWYKFKG